MKWLAQKYVPLFSMDLASGLSAALAGNIPKEIHQRNHIDSSAKTSGRCKLKAFYGVILEVACINLIECIHQVFCQVLYNSLFSSH